MIQQLQILSLASPHADVELREQWVLSEGQKVLFYEAFKAQTSAELVIVSTCNRIEFILFGSIAIQKDIIDLWSVIKQQNEFPSHALRHYIGQQAATHVLEVIAGLKSRVPGDLQIGGQIRQAVLEAQAQQQVVTIIDKLVQFGLSASKEAVRTTQFRSGATSVPYAAARQARLFAASQVEAPVLLIGAGQMATEVAFMLAKMGCRQLLITNRTASKAKELAKRLYEKYPDFQLLDVIPFNEIATTAQYLTIIISCIVSDEVLIESEDLSPAINRCLIDLGMPRTISPLIANMEGQMLYDVDILGAIATKALEARQSAIPMVKAIVDQYVFKFSEWLSGYMASRTIKIAKSKLEQIFEQEVNRISGQLSGQQKEVLDQITQRIVQRLLKQPAKQLKAVAADPLQVEHYSTVMQGLFGN